MRKPFLTPDATVTQGDGATLQAATGTPDWRRARQTLCLALADGTPRAYPYTSFILVKKGVRVLTREPLSTGTQRLPVGDRPSASGVFCLRRSLIFIRQVLRRLIESRFPRPAIIPS